MIVSINIGIDIGGVIIDRVNDHTDTSFFGDRYLETTAVSEAFAAIRDLVDCFQWQRIYLVSKCGAKIQQKTVEWLEHHKFWDQTGMCQSHLHFCLKRHDKAGICQNLGITHFVDDRLEVLGHLRGIVSKLFLFRPRAEEVAQFNQFLPLVNRVNGWDELAKLLLAEKS